MAQKASGLEEGKSALDFPAYDEEPVLCETDNEDEDAGGEIRDELGCSEAVADAGPAMHSHQRLQEEQNRQLELSDAGPHKHRNETHKKKEHRGERSGQNDSKSDTHTRAHTHTVWRGSRPLLLLLLLQHMILSTVVAASRQRRAQVTPGQPPRLPGGGERCSWLWPTNWSVLVKSMQRQKFTNSTRTPRKKGKGHAKRK